MCLSFPINFLDEIQSKLVTMSSVNLKISVRNEQLRNPRDGEEMKEVKVELWLAFP